MEIFSFSYKALKKAKQLAPYKDGHIRNAIRKWTRYNGFVITYKVAQAMHIIWQQEGFEHYKSKRMVTKNQGFIDNTVAEIIQMAVKETGGSERDAKETTRNMGFRQHWNGNQVFKSIR